MLKIQIKFNALLKRFSKDARGAVAIIFGITIIPILLAVGLAVDYSVTSDNKAKLDSAADAAALAGAIRAKTYLAENQGRGLPDSAVIAQAKIVARTEADKHFDASLGALVNTRNITKNIVIDIKTEERLVTVSLKYNADVSLAFGPLVSINDFRVSNDVQAVSSLPTYLDLYVVLDNSGSMGIGATDDDIRKMKDINLTKATVEDKVTGNWIEKTIGCEVACHINGETSYNNIKARTGSDKITMRIDVLRDAIASMLGQANQLKTTSDLFRFSLFAFSNDLVPLQAASTDYTVLNAAISSLDLDNRNGGTNFHFAIGEQLPLILKSSDNGSSALKRKAHVIIITDGVENHRYQSTYGVAGDANFTMWFGNGSPLNPNYSDKKQDILQAFNPRICDGLKSKGAQVTVLNVKYIVPPLADVAKGEFDYVENNIIGREATTIAGCASSSSDYYSANTPSEIKAAVNAIFGNILRPVRLTH